MTDHPTPAELLHRDGVTEDEAALVPPGAQLQPIPLRWGLNDVMWGDDDSVTVMLSGPDGEPYWLELEQGRAAVLREDLAGPPADQAAVREQLLAAIDDTRCEPLGYAGKEALLAAYDASRTPADQGALRDRIAAAIWERQNPGRRWADCEHPWGADAEADADAVLAVLPSPVDQAAVLREEADRIDATRAHFPIAVQNGITWATAELRRHAAECPECGTTAACNGGPCPLRRRADETAATDTGCWCGHAEHRHWTDAPSMTFPNGCHDCRGWDGAHVYGQDLPWVPEQLAAGAHQPGLRERHRAAWAALTPEQQAARLAELDADDGAQP
ncbi:hypothetical protein ACH4MG_27400 [Streptomyces sp. NPDC017454]|uniref:hypothetical protein n=1 Tax=Streptomyces sp. NPDC017454 TaxID=3364997 RepID=UPI0037B011D5